MMTDQEFRWLLVLVLLVLLVVMVGPVTLTWFGYAIGAEWE